MHNQPSRGGESYFILHHADVYDPITCLILSTTHPTALDQPRDKIGQMNISMVQTQPL
jgi:hypothetical protein